MDAWRTTTHEVCGGCRLAVHEYANDDTAPHVTVLLLHATGFHARAYEVIAAKLVRECRARVVAPDLPFHGETAVLNDGVEQADALYSWQNIADRVVAPLCDALRLDERGVVVFGHSMGGAVGHRLAEIRPRVVRSLVAFEPIIRQDVEVETVELRVAFEAQRDILSSTAQRRKNSPHETVQGAFEAHRGRAIFAAWHDDCLLAYVKYGFHWETAVQSLRGTLLCEPANEARMYQGGPIHVHPTNVHCPVMMLIGGLRRAQRPECISAEKYCVRTGSYLVIMPNASHFGPFEDPNAICECVRRSAMQSYQMCNSKL